MPAFRDHFSGHAALYARVRPRYPDALFDWLAARAPHRMLAWDAGTGNGQAAVALADRFGRVVATDPSAAQIAEAEPYGGVEYRVLAAEVCPVEAGSAALVTAAQAAHWFDLPAFFAAARTALCPGGLLALWGYELMTVSPEVDRLVEHLYRDVLGAFWPPERRMVEEGYRGVELPFGEIRAPEFEMAQRWDLAGLLGYLRSWSATQRYAAAHDLDPVRALEPALTRAWGDAPERRLVRFPLFLRVGRAGSASSSPTRSPGTS